MGVNFEARIFILDALAHRQGETGPFFLFGLDAPTQICLVGGIPTPLKQISQLG